MNKANLILLFSHILTEEQEKEAKESLKCQEIIYMPEELKKLWGSIVTENKELIEEKIKGFLLTKGKKGDYILIQGEWGVTYNLINFCKEQEMIPIYSSTKREALEKKDGEKIVKISVFKHRGFVAY